MLRLVAAGRSNREIAAELFISAKTASVHVSNILAKLGAATRTEAAAIAHRRGLEASRLVKPVGWLSRCVGWCGRSGAPVSEVCPPRHASSPGAPPWISVSFLVP